MSKQSEAKEKQRYVPKAKPQTCMNCKHFTHEQILMKTPWSSYTKDTNLRCTLGGFKVMKMGTCNEWSNAPHQPCGTDDVNRESGTGCAHGGSLR